MSSPAQYQTWSVPRLKTATRSLQANNTTRESEKQRAGEVRRIKPTKRPLAPFWLHGGAVATSRIPSKVCGEGAAQVGFVSRQVCWSDERTLQVNCISRGRGRPKRPASHRCVYTYRSRYDHILKEGACHVYRHDNTNQRRSSVNEPRSVMQIRVPPHPSCLVRIRGWRMDSPGNVARVSRPGG